MRATALGEGKLIDLSDLPPSITSRVPPLDRASIDSPGNGTLSATDLEEIERATFQRVFEQVNGDKVMAGKMLGISRATLYRKLKRYNIGGRADLASTSARLQ